MVDLPIGPDQTLVFVTGLVPLFVGAGLSWMLIDKLKKQNTSKILTPILIGAVICFSSLIYWGGESEQYRSEMTEIIETSSCDELLIISHEVNKYYKGLIVDEVVLRCLSNTDRTDPVLMLLLSEVRN